MKKLISKSLFVQTWLCPKGAWLKRNKPDVAVVNENTIARMETGREVGEIARGLFGPYCDVTSLDADGRLDLERMAEITRAEMEKGTNAICEASFFYADCYCAVDILRKDRDGWAIYEVKSSTDPMQDQYIADVAFQKHVLEHLGIKVTSAHIVCLNNQYVLEGDLDLQALFMIADVTDVADEMRQQIPAIIEEAKTILASREEPGTDIGENCKDCSFWDYCTRMLPKPNVFHLYRMKMGDKVDLYRKGLISFSQLNNSGMIKNEKQRRQIEFELQEKRSWIDQKKIREFLQTLTFPLYFLDFESMQTAIPFCQGTKPYSQIVFQYSLHYIEHEHGEQHHKEFLAESGPDPRRSVAEALCRDIPRDVCVTAYNKAFECTRIRELAEAFPDLAEHLLCIADNIQDLLIPFQKGYYYNRAMGGSFSIKSVLPALYPNDPLLDYHNLEGIHNGGEAMSLFPKIQHMNPEDKAKARENLLRYCELDTFAMVKVWEELVSVASAL